jgi:hypothetical protein
MRFEARSRLRQCVAVPLASSTYTDTFARSSARPRGSNYFSLGAERLDHLDRGKGSKLAQSGVRGPDGAAQGQGGRRRWVLVFAISVETDRATARR